MQHQSIIAATETAPTQVFVAWEATVTYSDGRTDSTLFNWYADESAARDRAVMIWHPARAAYRNGAGAQQSLEVRRAA